MMDYLSKVSVHKTSSLLSEFIRTENYDYTLFKARAVSLSQSSFGAMH